MVVVLAESMLVYQPPAWWQRALVADGQSWVWIGTLIISLTLVAALALRYLYSMWWLNRIRLLRSQGLISSSELHVGQCAHLQLLEGREDERLRQWRTMVRRVEPDFVHVDLPVSPEGICRFTPGTRVALAVNAIDSLYVMDTEVVGMDRSGSGILYLRRQPLLHRLQRRQFARVELFVPATVEVVGGKGIGRYAGTVLDIGGGGMCLQVPIAVEPGSIVRVDSPSLSSVVCDSVRLTVVGVSETVVDGRMEYRLHCAFVDLNTEHAERIARFVHQKQREKTAARRWRIPQDNPLSDLSSTSS